MPSQQWDTLTNEIMGDVVNFMLATPSTKVIIGIVQWNGKLYARPVFQPTTLPIGDAPEGGSQGISVMFEPPTEWNVIDLKVKPTVDGKPSEENMPIFYFLITGEGNGLGIPSRYSAEKKIGWSHNPDIIDQIEAALQIAREKVASA
jgi:hypothetical protein